MIKGGSTGGQLAPQALNVTTATYGKTIKLPYGLVMLSPDLIWYNDWETADSPVNSSLFTVTGGSTKKKSSKKSNITYYSAAVDFVLGHAPILGVLSAYYNNQKFNCQIYSASGIVSGGAFTFVPNAASSKLTSIQTIPSSGAHTLNASSFISDISVNLTSGDYLSYGPSGTPGPMEYSVNSSGAYVFNAAQAGQQVKILYHGTVSAGATGILAGVLAVTVNEQINGGTGTATFDDYGGPGSVTEYGYWDRPLWNCVFAEPGSINTANLGITSAAVRYPYVYFCANNASTTIYVPAALNGYPITVYYAMPQILKSDGSWYSSAITPLSLLNLEFEPSCGSGSEYANHPAQQIVNNFCAGLGTIKFDLSTANSIPNLNFECIGAFTQWPNGDCDVVDILTDIICSGYILVATTNTALYTPMDFGPIICAPGYTATRSFAGYVGYLGNTYLEFYNSIKLYATYVFSYHASSGDVYTFQGTALPSYDPYVVVSPSGEITFTSIAPTAIAGTNTSELVLPHGANCNNYSNGGYFNPGFPPGNGTLLGNTAPMSLWCRANGITAALNQDTQKACIDIIKDLLTLGNSAPVYSGDKLNIIPYDEVSSAGNGAVYIAPTASGPIASLTDADFYQANEDPPIAVSRKRRADCDNVVSVEYIDRLIDYYHNAQTAADQMSVALYGTRKGGTLDSSTAGVGVPSGVKSLQSIYSVNVAQAIASILAKVSATDINKYKFTLKAEWFALEAMDLVEITDLLIGLNQHPVRLTSVRENDKHLLECEAEDFIYGLHHPDIAVTTQATGALVSNNINPGVVNTPIIFEPTANLCENSTQGQLWFAVSGVDPNYGGCNVFVSIDGGESYDFLGTAGAATSGYLLTDFPIGTDPDTVNSLAVDLTESSGSLATATQTVADNFLNPCYLSSATANQYEAICPTIASLTAFKQYSMSGYIRRGVKNTTESDHPAGCRFAVLDGNILKVTYPTTWIGKELYFKFAAFNKQLGQQNPLGDCAVYNYTLQGSVAVDLNFNPNVRPTNPLSIGNSGLPVGSTYIINMSDFAAFYPTGAASYVARTFSTLDPGAGNSVTCWVTIYDPTFGGDTSGISCPAYCDTSTTRALETGYLLVGVIVVYHPGTGTVLTIPSQTFPSIPGGSPYSYQIVAYGGTAPYTWSLVSVEQYSGAVGGAGGATGGGDLGPGFPSNATTAFTLSSSGVLSGELPAVGGGSGNLRRGYATDSLQLTVKVTDSVGASTTNSFVVIYVTNATS